MNQNNLVHYGTEKELHDQEPTGMQEQSRHALLELKRIQQRIESISEERIKDSEMIAQILNQMPSTYENKVNHIKHLIDIGNKPTLVEVVGYL